MDILYHLGKANMVADALSRKSMSSLSYVPPEKREMVCEVHQLASLGVRLIDSGKAGVTAQDIVVSSLVVEIKEHQYEDPPLSPIGEHNSQPISVSLFKRDWGLQMALYEALYWRRCRSPIGLFYFGENQLVGPDLIQQAVDKVQVIREKLLTAQSRQKSYANNRRRKLEFEIGDWVFLKVSSMKGVMRFGKKGKLNPRYIRPYKIIRTVGTVAYELELPSELESVNLVFHVSMLCKCIGDPSKVVPMDDIQVIEQLSYEEVPVSILDRQVAVCRTD
ncbi:uncharacterized protein LOC132054236 [Lycium ferocissimum]|uniref:uncharacterized protein LOC132054236 n=1 Tax=Lycium ferocissimum TaxID=112874 RepID=UPI002815568F|nr:uncharacterized protein LOC132054236 [Lycium ferocissimum]